VEKRKHEHYNYWVSIFKPSLIYDIWQVADEWSIEHLSVDPKGTTHSKEHDNVMKKYGIDRHRASAYIIAKRTIENIKT